MMQLMMADQKLDRFPQIPFDFKVQSEWGLHSFHVGVGVQTPVTALFETTITSPYGFFLQGESGSGKTHLGHCWQEKKSAVFLQAHQLDYPLFHPEAVAKTNVVIDNLAVLTDRGERNLFHLLNHLKEKNTHALLLSRSPLGALATRLPDLLSRLKTLYPLAITPPDEPHVEAILAKRFSDYALKVDPKVPSFLAVRLPRSYEKIQKICSYLMYRGLAEKKPLSIPWAKTVLETEFNLN